MSMTPEERKARLKRLQGLQEQMRKLEELESQGTFAEIDSQPMDPNQTPEAKEGEGWARAKAVGMDTLDKTVRALDYVGGIGRTSAAGLYDLGAVLTGAPTVTRVGDVGRAFKGDAPLTSEFLQRAGAPEGPKLSEAAPWAFSETGEGLPFEKGGMFDPSVRGAVGFAGDVATDPLTYLTGGTATALKAGSQGGRFLKQPSKQVVEGLKETAGKLSPAQKAVGKYGDHVYQQALKNVDKKTAEFGAKPISKTLLEATFSIC